MIDFSVYRGVSRTLKEIAFGLLDGLLMKGHHVCMDNHYNSVSLAEDLYEHGMHCTGTLRLPRGTPLELKRLAGKKLSRDSFQYRRKGNTFILCWYDTRLVSLITNAYSMDRSEYVHHKRVRKQRKLQVETVHLQRPVAIKEYTKYMQGVDRFDQLVKYYSFLRKTMKWTKKMVLYLLQLALQNSYALYLKYSTDTQKIDPLQVPNGSHSLPDIF